MNKINNKKEFVNYLNNNNLIILDFFAEWCGPCKQLTPHLQEICENNKDISIGKINIENEDCNDICELYNITSLPTLLFIKEKKCIDNLKVIGFDLELILKNINIFKELDKKST